MEKIVIEQTLDIIVPKFQKACQQVRQMNKKIENLQIRYDRAKRDHQKSFRYTLRLQIATVEGVRNAFYEYACKVGAEIEELQFELALFEQDDDDVPIEC